MLREHQSIVGTATAQLPEMLIPHRRKKVRRIPKVCSSGDSSRAQGEMRSRLNFYVLTWLNLSESFVFSFAVQKLKMKQQRLLANRVFPVYPLLSAVVYCLIYPHLYIFCSHKESPWLPHPKVYAAGERALMMSVALFFKYVTTAFVEGLLYYIECESWSLTLMGTRGWGCFRQKGIVRTI